MTKDVQKIKVTTIRNESTLKSIEKKLENICKRQDYHRDFMNTNREKINWNKNKVHVAIGGVALVLAVIPIFLYFY